VGCLRPFFRAASRKANQPDDPAARTTRWADVYVELTAAGYGTPAELGRYTERQLKLFHARLRHHQQVRRAELIEDISTAYGGCQSKDAIKAMQRRIDVLLRDTPSPE
jgi:hypothetical protein